MKFNLLELKDRQYLYIKLLTMLFVVLADACVHDPFITPTQTTEEPPTTTIPPSAAGCDNQGKVCFESSVLPIFLSSCASSGCHNATSKKEGYVLDTYTNIMKRGVAAGDAKNSKLYKVLFDGMPPNAPLSQAQKDSIALWINQGANNTINCNCSCDATQFSYATIIKPLVTDNCQGCHKQGSLSGNVDLSTYDAIKKTSLSGQLVGSITHAAGFSAMPPGGSLSECQINQIKSWVTAGSPNN